MLVIKVIDPYTSEVHVIHYAKSRERKIGILEDIIPITKRIELAMYKDDISMWDAQEGIRRARSRKNETDYKLFSNNCESFVNWALTGEDVTDQGKSAPVKIGIGAALGVGTAIGIIGAVAIGVGALMGKLGSDDSDEEKE